MNRIGIIAEFNPFHNGHKYLIDTIKSKYPDPYIIVALSGNYVQRGEPAIIDKYRRTNIVLDNGANLVVEIPVKYAISSAEDYAFGAIATLDNLKVEEIIFGCETENIDILEKLALFFKNESPYYSNLLRQNLNLGYSYPKSRTLAIKEVLGNEYADVLNKPNNILAIEYIRQIKQLHSNIKYSCIKRIGQNFNDKIITSNISSATAIRNTLKDLQSKNINTISKEDNTSIKTANADNMKVDNINMNVSIINQDPIKITLPIKAYEILIKCYKSNELIYIDDFSDILYFKLFDICKFDKNTSINKLLEYKDISEFLANSIYKNFIEYKGLFKISNFIMKIKSKTYTYSRISRCLFSIILDLYENENKDNENIDFVNVLGFDKKGQEVLSLIKKEIALPLITKNSAMKDNKEFLLNCYRTDLYNQVLLRKSGIEKRKELIQSVIIKLD